MQHKILDGIVTLLGNMVMACDDGAFEMNRDGHAEGAQDEQAGQGDPNLLIDGDGFHFVIAWRPRERHWNYRLDETAT